MKPAESIRNSLVEGPWIIAQLASGFFMADMAVAVDIVGPAGSVLVGIVPAGIALVVDSDFVVALLYSGRSSCNFHELHYSITR